MTMNTVAAELLRKMDVYWSAANYLAVGQIYLYDNPLLKRPPALIYRRTNHDNFHVRGYKEEGTITTPFDMTALNDLDRFHLVMDTIYRLPQTGDKGIYPKQQLKDKLIEHKQYTDKYGQDLPEIGRCNGGGRKVRAPDTPPTSSDSQ